METPAKRPTVPAKRAVPRFSVAALLTSLVLEAGAVLALGPLSLALTGAAGLRADRATAIASGTAALFALVAGAIAARLTRRVGFPELGVAGVLVTLGGYVPLLLARPMGEALFAWVPEGALWFAPLFALLGNVLIGSIGATLAHMLGAGTRLDFGFAYEASIARAHLRLSGRLLGGLALFALGIIPGVIATALLLRREKRSPTVIMTVLSIGGVAVGVMALCVVLSVMSGFELDLKKKILGTNAHAVVLKFGPMDAWPAAAKVARATEGVIGVTPFILNEVMITTEQNLAGVLIKGIDPATVDEVTELAREIADPSYGEGRLEWLATPEEIPLPKKFGAISDVTKDLRAIAEELARKEKGLPAAVPDAAPVAAPQQGPTEKNTLPGILVGRELARSLKVFVGDPVTIVSPIAGELGPMGPQPKSMQFRVAGVFYSGMYEYDSKFVYIALPVAQRFFKLGDAVTGLELKVAEIDDARRISRAVLAALEGYPFRVKDWGEMNRNLFSALKLEKLVMAVILAFIVLVACFNILSTLVMLVLEKGKEISILKSMGARDGSIMKIFVLEGLAIGTIGTTLGIALGLGLCGIISVFPIPLDPEVYYIPSLPVRLDAVQFVMVAITAVLLSFLATIFPALYASRLSPVEGLRND